MQQYTTVPPVQPGLDLAQALADHDRLVHWVVRRQWLGALPYAEALQVGRLALWQAVQRFDPTRGTAFSSYAVPTIARAVWRAVAQAHPHPQEVLTAHPPQTAPDLDAAAEVALIHAALRRLVAALPKPLATVIVAHYGLTGEPPQTFAAIGQRLGVTRQRVQQLHVEALLWLAHPAHSLTLRQRLDRNTVADYQAYLARRRSWQRARRGAR